MFITDKNGLPTIEKSAGATLDYSFDFSSWLQPIADTIQSYTLTKTPADITITQHAAAGGVITAWVAGGKAGQDYKIRCRIVTTGGRIEERTMKISVKAER